MNKTFLRLTLGVAFATLLFSTSCQKDEPINPQSPPTTAVGEDDAESSKRLFLEEFACEFSDVSGANYHIVRDALFGTASTVPTSPFNNYSNCHFQPMLYDPNCCSPVTVELGIGNGVPGGFEEWGAPPPLFAYDPLSDGVISAAEQLAFFNRCVAEANAVRPVCQGGFLILNGLTFSSSPTLTPGGMVIHVFAHYAPVCFSFFP